MTNIERFINRLKKCGVTLDLLGNFPWVYIAKINGNTVKEKRDSEYGFVLGYTPIRPGEEFNFLPLRETFELIRKYK